ncbi:unnamed protein product [Mycena citricolor]|uniref:ATPase V1 complex subunit H C-terminal domain-containing protein n=1 Tax=Mycena citricolor TaxID=2018698 RepID=A0AAD2JVZ8_9AGAR|nr:unnamed protein product [Mycena citricolor]
MSLSLVSSQYLDENSAKIRTKPVPWEGYQRADLITTDELSLIKKVDRQSKAKTEALLLSDAQNYALLYLRLLKNYRESILCSAFLSSSEMPLLITMSAYLCSLVQALDTQDEFVQLKAAQILTVLLCSESTLLQASQLHPFLTFLAGLVQGNSPSKCDIAVQCLEALLARPECRQAVWAIPGVTAGFVEILKHKPGPQMTYQVAFCIWLLSFEQDVAEQINKKYDIIPLLIDAAKAAVKEKVIRVIVATFRNLVVKAPSANLPSMLVAQLLPFVKNLCTRKWSDEDVVEDIQYLREELASNFQSLTTYDEYSSELLSGHLSWSPVHESDDFWKENATKLNDKDYEQLKVLVRLLKESEDPVVLAVAAHDLGQYVKHYERGKKLLNDFGAKTRVMELMTHQDSDVRYRALVSVQHLVSQPWVTV